MKPMLLIPAFALALAAATPAPAEPGQSFPNHKCTCKKCGAKGADGTAQDVTGQCATVCKDKTVYDKGSEANDYCKAKAAKRTAADHVLQKMRPAAAAPR